MKTNTKLYALLVGCMLFSAVNVSQAQVKFGPIVGLNVADVVGDDVNSDGRVIGAHAGVFVNLGITDNFMIEPQVLFSMKGAKLKGDDLKMNWVEFPIWVRYEMESGLNFNAGPFLGLLLSGDVGDFDVKDNYKSIDFGLGAGIGYQMGGGLGFHLNYNAGISNIGEEFDVQFLGSVKTDAKTSNIKLSVSYMIGGKRD